MYKVIHLHNIVGLVLMFSISMSQQAFSQSETQSSVNQTTMAAELKSAIEQGGAAAAKTRFAEIYPSQIEKYSYDSQAFMTLITDYMNAGDVEAAMLLGEINANVGQDIIREKMAASQPEMLALMEQQLQALEQAKQKQQQTTQQVEQQNQTQTKQRSQGQLRTDLARFTGLYSAADNDSPHRQLWVSKTCEGQLVVGATWGDATPWWMRTATDTVFTYSDSFFSLAIEFKMDADNQAIELSHDLENMANPLVRTGPLTTDYPACIEPHRR